MAAQVCSLIIYRKETSQNAKHSTAVSVSGHGVCGVLLPQRNDQRFQFSQRQSAEQVASLVGRVTNAAQRFAVTEVGCVAPAYVDALVKD